MKKLLYSVGICLAAMQVQAQVVNSTDFYIGEDAVVSIGQDVINEGKITNNGKLHLQSNLNNNGAVASKGEIVFNGINKQTIRGEKAISASQIKLENDIRLESPLTVTEQMNFRRGVVESSNQSPLVFASNAKHDGASDYSHVRGVVQKEGNGSFEFPLGDGTNYRSFVAEGNGQTLLAEYIAKSPLNISGELEESVKAINETEYWSLRSNELSANAKVSLTSNSDMNDVAFLKRGTWEVSEDAKLNATQTGTLFTMARGGKEKPAIGVWPNPTDGEFNLKLSGLNANEIVTVSVTDQAGEVVLKKEGRVADLRKAYQVPSNLAAKELNIVVVRNDNQRPLYQKLFLNK
jgi:hypothetical protein